MNSSTIIAFIIGGLVVGGAEFGLMEAYPSAPKMDASKNADRAMMMHDEEGMAVMATQMLKSGMMIQDMGMKYKDDALVSEGKDLSSVGQKYQMDLDKTNSMMKDGKDKMMQQ